MPFGLRCAPQRFQRMMNTIFADLIGKFIFIYIDDVVVFSNSPEEHEQHLKEVFDRLRQYKLSLKKSKCKFGMSEVKLLGYIVSKDGLRANPEKVEAIKKMSPPTSLTEVRSFLGAVGYYRQCINNFAHISAPLVELTKKNNRFKWTTIEENAWNTLKEALMSSDIMAHPDPSKPYKLFTDASKHCIGGILVQEDASGIERPIQYVSKQLNPRQQLWPAIQREGFGLIYCIKKLQPYLYGSEFTCYTDHKPLKSLFTNENQNTSIQKWSIYLAEMGAKISYYPGRRNIRADWLSRLKEHQPYENLLLETEDDTLYNRLVEIAILEDQLINDQHWEEELEHEMQELLTETTREKIPWEYFGLDKEAIIEEQKTLTEYDFGKTEMNDYVLIDELLYTLKPPTQNHMIYPRLVLPPSAQEAVARRCHTEVGHMSLSKTLARIHELYKWPGMRQQVHNIIRRCAKCQVHHEKKEKPPPTQMPTAKYPNQILGVDYVGPFNYSPMGNRYLITCIDHCTGWVVTKAVPTKENIHMLRFFELEYIPTYGVPETVIMDNSFREETTIKPYLEAIDVDVRFIAPHHPQSNSKVERFHRTLKQMMRKICNARGSQWEFALAPSLLAYRTAVSSVTEYSPFYLTFGRHAFTNRHHLLQRDLGSGPEAVAAKVDELSLAFRDAARRTEESRLYNNQRLQQEANAVPLTVGDHIIVRIHDRRGMDPKWSHGFLVTRIRGSVITAVGPKNKIWRGNREYVKRVEADSDWESLNRHITPYMQRKTNAPFPIVHQDRAMPRHRNNTDTADADQDADAEPQHNYDDEIPTADAVDDDDDAGDLCTTKEHKTSTSQRSCHHKVQRFDTCSDSPFDDT